MNTDVQPLHSRHLGISAFIRSYMVFIVLIAIFNVLEYGGFAIFVVAGVVFFSLPAIVIVMGLYLMFPEKLNQWYIPAAICLPIVSVGLTYLYLGTSDRLVTSTAVIATVTLPICAIYFMRQEMQLARRK